jgi:hypothetical protein
MPVTLSDNEHTLSPKTASLMVNSCHPIATSMEVDTPPLRVVTLPIVLPSLLVVSPKIRFTPPPSGMIQSTYHNGTGI